MEIDFILAAKGGDEAAFSELCKRYSPLIDSMTDKYSRMADSLAESREDLRQEASVAFYRALMSFDTEQDRVSFGLYAKICIRNCMVSLLRKHHAGKKQKTAGSEEMASPAETGATLDREELVALTDRLLTVYEKTVFFLYIDGKSYRDIAISLGVSVKSVDNALFRAKTKLRHGYHM